MPDLLQSLQKQDVGHLHIVADLWGVEISARDTETALKELCTALLGPELLAEIVEALPPPARAALEALRARSGRIPWSEFTRQFGEIREMGPGKRDRERPQNAPASASEVLYYRAMLARAFFDTPSEPVEFAYIPDDLLALMGASGIPDRAAGPLGRPASPAERAYPVLADDRILDEATTLLAALRLGISPPETRIPAATLQAFLRAAGLLKGEQPQPEPVREFLEAPRHSALKSLRGAWTGSEEFNELHQVPGLVLEGEWKNRPRETRTFLLDLLNTTPAGKWWSLPSFMSDLRSRHPDFQRPAGEYDSWFIKRASDGEYLRGFKHWDHVDGALVRYFLTGPCYWLGLVDLAAPAQGVEPAAFQVRPESGTSKPETARWHIASQGKITVPELVPRTARYQVSRFCEWLTPKGNEHNYQITPASLQKAREQGLPAEHLLPLLARHSRSGVPPALVKALKRWQAHGTEARLEQRIILKVSSPEVLKALRKSRAARFLGEALGPSAVIVKAGAQPRVLAALAELGYLAEEEAPEG